MRLPGIRINAAIKLTWHLQNHSIFQLVTQSAKSGWYVVAILMLVNMIGYVDRQILSLLIGPVKLSLSLSDSQIGLLQGFAFVILFALLGVPLGLLADRFGRKPVLACGLALWCMATVSCGLTSGFWSLFLCRLVADYFPGERRALATSIYQSAGSMGVGLAFTLGGQIVDQVAKLPTMLTLGLIGTEAWRIAFAMVGAAGLMALPLVLAIRSTDRAGNTPELRNFLRKTRSIVVPHFGALAAYAAIAYSVLAWAPAFFMRHFAWTPAHAGFDFGLTFAVCSVVGVLVGGWWSTQLRSRGMQDANYYVMQVALAAVVLPAMLAPLMPTAAFSLALYGIVAFFLSVPTGCSAAALQDLAPPPLRAQFIAVYYAVVSIGGAGLGPLVVGLLNDFAFRSDAKVGWSLSTTGAAFGLICLVLMLIARRAFRKYLSLPGVIA